MKTRYQTAAGVVDVALVERDGTLAAHIDERELVVDAFHIDERRVTLRIGIGSDAVTVTVAYTVQDGAVVCGVKGRSWTFRQDRGQPCVDSETSQGEAADLVAGMPGKVLEVLVTSGDRVQAGTALVVLEAMKMETTLRASCDACVGEVLVEEGSMVGPGQMLLRLSSLPADS